MLIWLAVIFSAVLLGASFSFELFWPGGWFLLAPLFIALERLPRNKALISAFLFGAIVFAVQSYWLLYIKIVTVKLMILALVSLAVYQGLFFVLFALVFLAVLKNKNSFFKSLWVCALFMSIDLLRMSGSLGNPFGGLASSQASLNILAITQYVGAYGLSFLMVLSNVLIANMITKRGAGEKVTLILVLALLVGIVLVSGQIAISDIRGQMNDGKVQKIIAIQPNIAQEDKLAPERLSDNINKLIDLTRSGLKQKSQADSSEVDLKGGSTMIIWPETAAPIVLDDDDWLKEQLSDIAVDSRSAMIVGSLANDISMDDKTAFTNSAYYIDSSGKIAGRYDKVKLVPFGEFLPLRSVLERTGLFNYSGGDLLPGDELTVFNGSEGRFSVMICFESVPAFPAREMTNAGAGLLFVITNDGWFGNSAELHQHLSQTRLRAIENGRYIVQASNTGVTTVIAPDGHIESRIKENEVGLLLGEPKYMNKITIFTRYGFLLPYLILIATVLQVLRVMIAGKGRSRKRS